MNERASFRWSGRTAWLLAALLLGLCFTSSAAAEDCMSILSGTLHDTSSDCSSQPSIDRALGGQIITWQGRDFLFVNMGNELAIWSLDNPQNPNYMGKSSFGVGNQGDSDYDLMVFTVCDDCRYGAAWYKMATVLFDLGTGQSPSFQQKDVIFGATYTYGGLTFEHDGRQYLTTTSGIGASCDGTATLYRYTAADEQTGLTYISCVETDVRPVLLAGGHYVNGYLYLGDSSTRVFLFRVNTVGTSISVTYLSEPMRAVMGRDHGLAVDLTAGVAVAANNQGMEIWDISNPGNPIRKSTIAGSYSRASVVFPQVFVALGGPRNTEETFDITNLSSPVPMHQDFWSTSHYWNYASHSCSATQGAKYSPDGTTLYLLRYSRLQMVDTSACRPSAPVADVAVSPVPAFPGGTVTVEDISTGAAQRSALWVTTGSSSDSAVVLGSSLLSPTTPDQRQLYLDPAILESLSYWAHVAVEDDEYPYVPGQTVNQIDTRAITIDRTPQVVLIANPVSVLLGETVTVTANAEGQPIDPGGGAAYRWTITPPDGSSYSSTGPIQSVTPVQSGAWSFAIEVRYLHEVGGSQWVANDTVNVPVAAVVASLSSSPASPLNTDVIVLDGSQSRIGPGAVAQYSFMVTGATVYDGCVGASAADTCSIPADTLAEGPHDFTLVVSDLVTGDSSTVTVSNQWVGEGHVNIDVTWQPVDVEIAELVQFDISGVASVDRALWDFGEDGCSGFPQVYDCTPLFTSCLFAAHRFSTPGPKTVSLTVETALGSVGPIKRTVFVQSTGICSGVCPVSLTTPSTQVAAVGGADSVAVSADVTCGWTAASSSSWISINSGSSGTGTGSVNFTVLANNGASRVGSLMIGGNIFTVTQAGTDRWQQLPTTALTTAGNTNIGAMAVLDSVLYVGTENPNGAEIWRTSDGSSWERVASGGFGDSESDRISSMAVFAGSLIVGTRNPVRGCSVYRSSDGAVWQAVVGLGFGSAQNTEVTSFASLGGTLFGGLHNSAGAEIWSTSDGLAWSLDTSFGLSRAGESTVTAMADFNGSLRAATTGSSGFRLWQRAADGVWSQQGLDGFGNPANDEISDLHVHDGALLAATANAVDGCGIWRSDSGAVWQLSNEPGFGAASARSFCSGLATLANTLFGAADSGSLGMSMWSSETPGFWVQSGDDGLGGSGLEVNESTIWGPNLVVATHSGAGLELWKLSGPELFSDGFEAGNATSWSSTNP